MLDWKQLACESNQQLAARDIVEYHLACAAGLPDADKIDGDRGRERLDYYAHCVQTYTESHLKQFHRKRWDYNNSEGYFRIWCMITVLQRDLGVRACDTLAILHVAVGRRLGYPLKLVKAKKGPRIHLFSRWDELGGERFNIETAGQGLDCFPDDYYREGAYQIDPEIERQACLLQSLTPREELATFLGNRGHHWLKLGIYQQAVEAFAFASALAPQNEVYLCTITDLMNRWRNALNAFKPPVFPKMYATLGERRYPGNLPRDIEEGILILEATELILANESHKSTWLDASRKGLPANVPTAVFVDFLPPSEWRMQFKYAEKPPVGTPMRESSLAQDKSSPDAMSAARATHNRFCFSITAGAKDHDV